MAFDAGATNGVRPPDYRSPDWVIAVAGMRSGVSANRLNSTRYTRVKGHRDPCHSMAPRPHLDFGGSIQANLNDQMKQDWQASSKTRVEPPIDVFRIDDIDALRVVADPLRLRILDELRRDPRTVKQLHERLPEVALSRLYYHVGLLERHRLIRVTQTRLVSGILEKHYQATAYKLSVDHALFAAPLTADPPATGLDVFLSAVLDDTRRDIHRSVHEGLIHVTDAAPLERQLYLGRCWARLAPQQVREFRARLDALVREFGAQHQAEEGDGRTWYEWLIGLYPTHAEPGALSQEPRSYDGRES